MMETLEHAQQAILIISKYNENKLEKNSFIPKIHKKQKRVSNSKLKRLGPIYSYIP